MKPRTYDTSRGIAGGDQIRLTNLAEIYPNPRQNSLTLESETLGPERLVNRVL